MQTLDEILKEILYYPVPNIEQIRKKLEEKLEETEKEAYERGYITALFDSNYLQEE